MAEPVDTSNQGRRVAIADQLGHRRGDEAHREPDTPLARCVGGRAVYEPHVVQRDLAGLELDHRRCRVADVDGDLLAAAQQVLGCERVVVGELVEQVGPRDDLQGSVGSVRRGECAPGGHHVGAAEAPVGRVLVPRDERCGVGLLGEQRRRPTQQVGAVEVFHRIEDRVVEHQVGQPRIHEMWLVEHRPAQRTPEPLLFSLEPFAEFVRGIDTHHPDRRHPAVLGEVVDLVGRQCESHAGNVSPGCAGAAPPGLQRPGLGDAGDVTRGRGGQVSNRRVCGACPVRARGRRSCAV